MESINKVELAGIIGSSRINTYGDKQILHATVATNYTYKSQAGETVLETTWHNLTYWGKSGQNLSAYSKGAKIHALGRLKQSHYTSQDGSDRYSYEVLAYSLEMIHE